MIKIKKYVSGSLFIFFVVAVAVLTAGLVFYDQSNKVNNNNSNSATVKNIDDNTNNSGNVFYTTTEVAQHNKVSDCWLIISGQVYDVSSYMDQHPGLAETIIPSCGSEASEAFATKGGTSKDHSGRAYALLKNYLIGSLK